LRVPVGTRSARGVVLGSVQRRGPGERLRVLRLPAAGGGHHAGAFGRHDARAATDETPQRHYIVGKDAEALSALKAKLPDADFARVIMRTMPSLEE